MALPRGMSKRWSTAQGHEFELLVVYTPAEHVDEWARYRDTLNDQIYTCRLAAFVTRFRAQPD